MKYIFSSFLLFVLFVSFCACNRQQYTITSMKGEYIPVNPTNHPDPQIVSLVNQYKTQLDEQMGKVIGQTTQYMPYASYQSLLTNFTADIILSLDTKYTDGMPVDFTLMNVNGHRAAIPEGNVTVGDIYSTYSFENELVVVHLKGTYVHDIFEKYARTGGAGISKTLNVIVKDKKLVDAKISGQPIDKEKTYTIVTLDYLAEGNDGMEALKNADSVKHTGITLRDFVLSYIEQQTKEGKLILSSEDNRVIIE